MRSRAGRAGRARYGSGSRPSDPSPPYGDPSQGIRRPANLVYRGYRIPEQWVAGLVNP
jgi:hypothetical protein